MYTPKHFEETRLEILHELIYSHPLASVVTLRESELLVNHLPFLVDDTPGTHGTLRGHVARENPIWKEFSSTIESAFIFQGPEVYISPNWYPSKHIHGKASPTWNYAVVHAFGMPKIIEDRNWLLTLLNDLTDKQESSQALPWKVSDAPDDYTDKKLDRIVGIEVPISRINGKWKANQNLKRGDKLGVVAGLESQDSQVSHDMATLVQKSID